MFEAVFLPPPESTSLAPRQVPTFLQRKGELPATAPKWSNSRAHVATGAPDGEWFHTHRHLSASAHGAHGYKHGCSRVCM